MKEAVARRRTVRAVACVVVLYGVLVSTHAGEFWPFSIYQMFSQAGQTWTRVLVRSVPPDGLPLWETTSLDDAPGAPFPLAEFGLRANDLASLIQEPVTPADLETLHQLLRPHVADQPLLVLRAVGSRGSDHHIDVRVTPFAVAYPDTLLVSPARMPARP